MRLMQAKSWSSRSPLLFSFHPKFPYLNMTCARKPRGPVCAGSCWLLVLAAIDVLGEKTQQSPSEDPDPVTSRSEGITHEQHQKRLKKRHCRGSAEAGEAAGSDPSTNVVFPLH